MEWGWISLAVGTIVLAFVVFRYRPKEVKYKFENAVLNDDELLFLKYLNEHRASPVKVDHEASKLMFEHVTYMMAKQKASHDFKEWRFKRLVENGATDIKEIVSGEFHEVSSGFKGFVKSPSHNKIMLSTQVDTCGMDIRRDIGGKLYFGIIFFKI